MFFVLSIWSDGGLEYCRKSVSEGVRKAIRDNPSEGQKNVSSNAFCSLPFQYSTTPTLRYFLRKVVIDNSLPVTHGQTLRIQILYPLAFLPFHQISAIQPFPCFLIPPLIAPRKEDRNMSLIAAFFTGGRFNTAPVKPRMNLWEIRFGSSNN